MDTNLYVRYTISNESDVFTVKPVDEDNVYKQWGLKIKLGLKVRQLSTGTFVYTFPEHLLPVGLRIKRVIERPKILSKNVLKLKQKPYITRDTDLNIDNLAVYINGAKATITHFDVDQQIIEVKEDIADTDDIKVDYYTLNEWFEYRGYYDEVTDLFVTLDLNPLPWHNSIFYEPSKGLYRVYQTRELLGRDIFIYMNPLVKLSGQYPGIDYFVLDTEFNGRKTVTKQTVDTWSKYIPFHETEITVKYDTITFVYSEVPTSRPYWNFVDVNTNSIIPASEIYEQRQNAVIALYSKDNIPAKIPTNKIIIGIPKTITDITKILQNINDFTRYKPYEPIVFHSLEYIDDEELLLLAKVNIIPNSSINSVTVIDTRTRGGGYREDVDVTNKYDVSKLIGIPTFENSVGIFYITKEVLTRFRPDQVEAVINRYKALGTLSVIRYVDREITTLRPVRSLKCTKLYTKVNIVWTRNNEISTRFYYLYKSDKPYLTSTDRPFAVVQNTNDTNMITVEDEIAQRITDYSYKVAHYKLAESAPVIVKINGAVYPGIYHINYATGEIIFEDPVPVEAVITVTYSFDGMNYIDTYEDGKDYYFVVACYDDENMSQPVMAVVENITK